MIFKIKDGCTVNYKECIQSPYQLEFICFHNANLFDNLTLITPEFPSFLAEIALEVLAGRVDTFESFLLQKIALTGESKRNEILYLGDQIQDFIEMLIYSDISNNYRITSYNVCYTKLLRCPDQAPLMSWLARGMPRKPGSRRNTARAACRTLRTDGSETFRI